MIQRLNAEVAKALQSSEVRQKLALQGVEALGSTPDEYGVYVRDEISRWASVVKQAGISLFSHYVRVGRGSIRSVRSLCPASIA